MNITFHKSTGIFHLYNNDISYLMMILPNGQIGQLYFGAAIRDREDFSHLLETCYRTNSAYYSEELNTMCLEHLKQEYPVYGTSDFREPAVEVIQENGSHLSDFQYKGYRIEHGKPPPLYLSNINLAIGSRGMRDRTPVLTLRFLIHILLALSFSKCSGVKVLSLIHISWFRNKTLKYSL